MAKTPVVGQSRAVVRVIEPGCAATCTSCDEPIKFVARLNARQVICNVYEDGKWDRVDHYHEECYEKESAPYGIAAV